MALRFRSTFVLVLVLLFVLPASAFAQRKLWGVTVSMTPVWQTAVFSKYLEGADDVSLSGRSFRVGVSRGTPQQGDWSFLLVRRQLKSGGTIRKDGVTYTTGGDVAVTGFEFEGFNVSGNVKNKLLFGVVIAAGVGAARGNVQDGNGATVPAKDVLTLFKSDIPIQPLFRLEFGVGVVLARGLRVRMSGGIDWSGLSGTVGLTYFFGDR